MQHSLLQLTERQAHSTICPCRMVIPTVLLPKQHSKLLPDNLQHFPSKLGYSAEDAMNVAKQVLIMIYTSAKSAADAAHVPLPPECALEVCCWPPFPTQHCQKCTYVQRISDSCTCCTGHMVIKGAIVKIRPNQMHRRSTLSMRPVPTCAPTAHLAELLLLAQHHKAGRPQP